MGAITSQITSLTSVYSTAYSDADQRKHQSSASLAFVHGIHRGSVNSPHKWPVTQKMFPFDDVIMRCRWLASTLRYYDTGRDIPFNRVRLLFLNVSLVVMSSIHLSMTRSSHGRSDWFHEISQPFECWYPISKFWDLCGLMIRRALITCIYNTWLWKVSSNVKSSHGMRARMESTQQLWSSVSEDISDAQQVRHIFA